ncbi:retron Ec67 family RNA-directed DNA polymerase/endonuclease [Staphylococcus pasteuri]|nr:retron Ec67 family RNA-directed DNA polymerase/endonuclease [Staphylococcus pasteuri]
MNIDLEDFFHTIHFGRVKGFFEKDSIFKVPSEVALIIAQLTCFKGALPQGAPTSPIISNMIGKILDLRLLHLCKKYNLDYTRYADDLTFSTNDKAFEKNTDTILSEIKMEIVKSGFKVNDKKTRIQNYRIRQDVTSLTVNKKINTKKTYFKNTRAMANNLYKNHEFFIDNKLGTIEQLEGRFAFINQIDKYNNKISKIKSFERNTLVHQKYLESMYLIKKENSKTQYFKNLNKREREYQTFLFYRHFYGNSKPIIVTEGKTDIRYIKAALKNLYKYYPDLIEKDGNSFIFKINFLKRFKSKPSKMNKLHYFLNILPDGADAMKNIYNYYNENDSYYPNYIKKFKLLGKNVPYNPVILMFDNELQNTKKPLSNFCKHAKLSNDKKNKLKTDYYINLIENLYLLTHQLMPNSNENELEDLFDQQALSKKIGGKTFKRGDGFDTNQYYGKEIFSQYIISNYKRINFDNFRPLLDNLVEIIKDYSKK